VRHRRLTAVVAVAAAALLCAPAAASAAPFGKRTLAVGAKGKDVKKLQLAINTLGVTTPTTGAFNAATRKAVKQVEAQLKLRVDGKVTRKEAKRILKAARKRKAKGGGTVFYAQGATQPQVTVNASQAGRATVSVIDVNNGLAAAEIPVTFSGAGSQIVAWNGIAATGAYAPDSTYQLKLNDPGSAGASLGSGQTLPFLFRHYAFPVPGKHNYGGAGARFGAARGGHTHQGQDVLAACGQVLVAAQGGVVKVKAYQASGAGYYLVIHGFSGTDTVYMHMIGPSYLLEGQLVPTGFPIGIVGTTGSSSGCHLHFEHWSAPGWYEGGAPYDPFTELNYWDTYS
jgi:murein DD-endopeptidase MepM/ murein hydrolase activator NlpD